MEAPLPVCIASVTELTIPPAVSFIVAFRILLACTALLACIADVSTFLRSCHIAVGGLHSFSHLDVIHG